MTADVDDGSIANDAGLLRRIRPDQIVDDANAGKRRPSSAAFKDSEMSVDAETILTVNGLDWKFSIKDHPGYSLARFEASHARAKALAVVHKPLFDNLAHTEVRGGPVFRDRMAAWLRWILGLITPPISPALGR
jgi:hypothetical protein